MTDARTYQDRKEYNRQWRARNKDKIKEYERRQYENRPEYREYRKRYVATRYLERRQLIDGIKLEQGCIDCGYREHACALDFDHRDPAAKLFTIAEGSHWKLERLLEEIGKCDVRCRNCHAVRTKEQKLGGRPRSRG